MERERSQSNWENDLVNRVRQARKAGVSARAALGLSGSAAPSINIAHGGNFSGRVGGTYKGSSARSISASVDLAQLGSM